jgi:hypothetical protein
MYGGVLTMGAAQAILSKLGNKLWAGSRWAVRNFIKVLLALLVAGGLIAVIANIAFEKYQERQSKDDPLDVSFISLLDRNETPLGKADDPPDSKKPLQFQLVVPDSQKLPRTLPPKPFPPEDCAVLWRIGVDAGGELPTSAKYKITLTGKVKGVNATIADLRAKIVDRDPPSDGSLISCSLGPMGIGPDEPVSCDLTKSDPASCEALDEKGEPVLLRNEKTIELADGEQETLQLSVKLPNDSTAWSLEALVVMGDESKWVTLDENGEAIVFRSLGLRDQSAGQVYREHIWSFSLGTIPLGQLGWSRGNEVPPNWTSIPPIPPSLLPSTIAPAPTHPPR